MYTDWAGKDACESLYRDDDTTGWMGSQPQTAAGPLSETRCEFLFTDRIALTVPKAAVLSVAQVDTGFKKINGVPVW